MIIYPAIDLKNGQCVRLYKGDMNKETVYNDDPAAQGLEWAQAGFSWIHVVDLDGAVGGMRAKSFPPSMCLCNWAVVSVISA